MHEVVLADHTFDVINYQIKEGTATGVHHSMIGSAGGRERASFNAYWFVGDYPTAWPPCPEPSGYRINITGSPQVTCEYYFTEDGIDETQAVLLVSAMRPVNDIPGVCEAPPGVTTFWDFPVAIPAVT